MARFPPSIPNAMKSGSRPSCWRPSAATALLFPLAAWVAGCGAGARERDPGVLVAAIDSDPGHLNPAITTAGGVHAVAGLLYNGLVGLTEDLTPVPELALRWEVEDSGRLYRFHLRPGVRWHDGAPFTAADVKFTFEELLLRYHARTRASLSPVLASIDVVGDLTVELRFHRPYAPLLQQLDVVEAPILPRHVYEGSDPRRHPANTRPVGTGPFRFVSYRPDAEIRYESNGDYFGGAPHVDAVVLRVIPDPGIQVVALEAGEVDWLFGVPGPDRARLRDASGVRLLQTAINPGGSNCILTLAFNLDGPVLGDLRVRRAIWHAVDREQILERVLFGEGRVATAPISSGIAFAHAEGLGLPLPDTAAAARLLEAAGWYRNAAGLRAARGVPGVADGTPLVLGFTGFPAHVQYGELLRAQLRAVGVQLQVELLEPAVFAERVFAERRFDTAMVSYCNGTDPEIGVRRIYDSANIGSVPFSNGAGYRDAAVDSLFDLAGSTLDVAERRRFYREIQEIVVRDLPYLWLIESVATRAHSTRCTGFATASHFAATARCGG